MQLKQAVIVLSGWWRPASQTSQSMSRATKEDARPAKQSIHSEIPSSLLYIPGVHGRQLACPLSGWYLPIPQSVHCVCLLPTLFVERPIAQSVQFSFPSRCWRLPGVHGRQLAWPVSGWYLPRLHKTQVVGLSVEDMRCWPAWHSLQSLPYLPAPQF